jgi:hypothetical protein
VLNIWTQEGREKVTEGLRKSHNEDLHNLYSSSNIIRMMKSRRMRWMGHVICMREIRNVYTIYVKVRTELMWPRIGSSSELK